MLEAETPPFEHLLMQQRADSGAMDQGLICSAPLLPAAYCLLSAAC